MKFRSTVLSWNTCPPRVEQGRQCTYNVTLRRVRSTIVAVEKQVCVCVCVCVFVCVRERTLVTQHAKRMRHIILSSVACPAVPYVSILPYNDFRKKFLNIKCFFLFYLQLSFETFLNLKRIQQETVIRTQVFKSSIHSLFVSYFNETWIFSTNYWKILTYEIFWTSDLWEPIFSARTDRQTDRQTDMTRRIVAFRNFANAPKMDSSLFLFDIVLLRKDPWRIRINLCENSHMLCWLGIIASDFEMMKCNSEVVCVCVYVAREVAYSLCKTVAHARFAYLIFFCLFCVYLKESLY